MPSPKRRRRLTAHEANFLHTQFKLNERPTAQEREMIAKHLELDRRTIQVWFQNRRAKVKRNAREGFQDLHGTHLELSLEGLEADRDAEPGAWVDVELSLGDVDQSLTFWPDEQGIGGGVETDMRLLGPPYRF
ncbi:hypothetical protein BGZ70_006409 [Mortierella alpina]|uniref:Homeobox domain-containing protein n=1 Tax=Mortierella alpina TaxID=64518 RepID=A0A9P6M705_MORAP|nr:hypothetical protein BGZ70_006409 [Mortierella alpina]